MLSTQRHNAWFTFMDHKNLDAKAYGEEIEGFILAVNGIQYFSSILIMNTLVLKWYWTRWVGIPYCGG
jgi:hypothetical protein